MVCFPYADVLHMRSFLQLNDQYCKPLSMEWTFHLKLRYVCARLLAGCILLNTSNGQVVVANAVQVYGRNRWLDIHREHLIPTNGEAVHTSLPPSIDVKQLHSLGGSTVLFRLSAESV
jgi:hypothetical protein